MTLPIDQVVFCENTNNSIVIILHKEHFERLLLAAPELDDGVVLMM